jgi:hypothetical protein
MRYVSVPTELSLGEIRSADTLLSPGRFVRFIPPIAGNATRFIPLDRLVTLRTERTKVTKGEWYRYAEIGDIDIDTGGVSFRKMRGFELPTRSPALASPGDILISTVRTYRKGIGLVAAAPDGCLVTTNAVMNICGISDDIHNVDLLYVYGFLRSDFFTEQVWSMLNRGMYPRMDRGALDKILIPIASEPLAIKYASALAQTIADKEGEIRRKHEEISELINLELLGEQKPGTSFGYSEPSSADILRVGRLDAAMYSEEFRRKDFLVRNYRHGSRGFNELELTVSRGQNLQVSSIGKSIYSDVKKPGFHRLMLPTHITEYGTVSRYRWLGNGRRLALLDEGDIVFGGEATFRCVVFCDTMRQPTISNIHALVLRSATLDLHEKIFIGAWLRYLGEWGYARAIAVGGQGGSLAISYLRYLQFPSFPEAKKRQIAKLYHNRVAHPVETPRLSAFVETHRARNVNLGIWELDAELKDLQETLRMVQEQIIRGEPVDLMGVQP